MTWRDALEVGFVIVGALGGGGAIVLAFSRFLGRLWADRAAEQNRLASERQLAALQAGIDVAIRRLDAALGNRSYLQQRLLASELDALRDCWQKARRCTPLLYAVRADDSGTDKTDLDERYRALASGHNKLLRALNDHELFLPDAVVALLDRVRNVVALELYQITHRQPFEDKWWDDGAKNFAEMTVVMEAFKSAVQARISAIQKEAETATTLHP